jgi:hypothetical protein
MYGYPTQKKNYEISIVEDVLKSWVSSVGGWGLLPKLESP